MANMTLVLDVVTNVDYGKISAEVEKIKSALTKIPDKVSINIQVDINEDALKRVKQLGRDLNKILKIQTSSDATQRIANDINALAQDVARTSGESVNALRRQAEAITQVNAAASSARGSTSSMRAEWSAAIARAKQYTDSLNTLAKGEKRLKDWSQMGSSPNKDARFAYTNLQDAVKGLREAAAAYDGTAESAQRLTDAASGVTVAMQNTEVVGRQTGTLFQDFGHRIAGAAGQFIKMFTGMKGITYAIRAVRQMTKEAISIDDSMTQLRIVTGESDEVFKQYGDDVAETAQRIGSSITDVLDATTVFARLGYSLSDSSILAELTAMLQRVGDIDAGEAQSALTSIIKAFDIDVGDMELVMDKLVTVGNGFPISVSEIATGMMNASSALAAAGNSFDKSVALLAAANTTLQDANKAATGLRTITARIRKTDSELDDLGEAMTESAYEELVGALTKYNVALRDSKGEYRDTYDIMQDIANVWTKMSSSEQAALAEMVAGNRQQTVFYSIIKNFKDVAAASLEAMNESPGAMRNAYAEWMESITAHIETLKAAFQGLAKDVMNSDMLKGLIDAGTWLINITDTVVRLTDNVGKLALEIGTITAIVKSIKSISSAVKAAKDAGKFTTIFAAATGQYAGTGNIIKFFADMSAGARTAAAGVGDSANTIQRALAGIAGGAQGAWKSLGLYGKIGLVTTGVALVVGAVQAYRNHMEKLRQAAEDNAKTYGQSQDALESYADRITELRTALADGTLTENEAYEAKKELYDIQTQLNESYGSAASGIDLVNGSLEQQIDYLKQLSVMDADKYLNENRDEIDRATRAMTGTMGGDGNKFVLGGEYVGEFNDLGLEDSEILKQIIGQYEHLKMFEGDGYTVQVRFVGDVTQAEEELNDFMTDMRNAGDKYGVDTDLFDDMFSGAQLVYKEATETIKGWENTYNEALRARMIVEASAKEQKTYSDGKNAKTAAQWLDEYTDAVQNYNAAISAGDEGQIAQARGEFEQLDATIQGLLEDSDGMGYFASMFNTVSDALNRAGIEAHDTREELRKAAIEGMGLKYSPANDDVKKAGMTRSQFIEAFQAGNNQDVYRLMAAYAQMNNLDVGQLTTEQIEAAADTFVLVGTLIEDAAEKAGDALAEGVEDVVKKATTATTNAVNGIQGAMKLLSGQAAGRSVSFADFSTAEMMDYAAAVEYVNGVYQLNAQRVNEIAQAKVAEQIAANKAERAEKQSEYLENAAQIEQYRAKLRDANFERGETAESIQQSIDALLAENAALKQGCDQYSLMNASLAEATDAYQNWLNAQSAAQAGDMFGNALSAINQINDVLNNSDSEQYGLLGHTGYQASLDLILPDHIDQKDKAAINSYLDSISNLFTYDENGSRTGLNLDGFISQAVQKGLLVEDGNEYRTAGQKTMEDFAEGLNLSLPMVQAIFGQLREIGAEFDWETTGKTLGDFGVTAYEAVDALQQIEGFGSLEVTLDMTGFETPREALDSIEQSLAELDAFKANPEIALDENAIGQIDSIIAYLEAQMAVILRRGIIDNPADTVVNETGSDTSMTMRVSKQAEQAEAAGTAATDASTALKKASESTVDAVSGIQNALKLLAGQAGGKSISPDDFSADDMADYASALEYVNGVYQLNAEKVNEIAQAKAEEQIQTNNANKANAQSKYLQNAAQIERYRRALEDMNFEQGETAESVKQAMEALQKENLSLKLDCDQYNLMNSVLAEATSAYQNWLTMKDSGQSGDMFDDSLSALKQINDVLNNTESDLFGRIGRSDYKAALDFILPDHIDREDTAAINSYLDSVRDMFTYDDSGNATGLNKEYFTQQALEQGLLIEDGDKYRIAGQKTMEDFAEGLNLSMPMVQAMFGELEEFGAKFSWGATDKTLGDLGVDAYEAADALRQVAGFSDLRINMDVSDFDSKENAVASIEDSLAALQDFKATPEIALDETKIGQVNDMIAYLVAQKQVIEQPAIMTVKTESITSEIGPMLSLFKQFQQAQNTMAINVAQGVDTSHAQSAINELVASIQSSFQNLSPDIQAKIQLDPSSEATISDYIAGLDAEAIIDMGVDASLVEAYQSSDIEATGTVRWQDDKSRLTTVFSGVGYVTWYNKNTPTPSGGSGGTALASGTTGAEGGKALVGELGLFLSSLTWRHV